MNTVYPRSISRLKTLCQTGVALLLALFAVGAYAAEFDFESGGLGEQDEFLKVDQAFILSVSLEPGREVLARWDMPDGYYLYRHQFKVATRGSEDISAGEPQIPSGKQKFDEYFGDVEVYYHNAELRAPLQTAADGTGPLNAEVGITYQGCADAGLCYPPETRWFDYDGFSLTPVGLATEKSASASGPASGPASSIGVADTEEQVLAGVLADENLIYALALFFLAGIGLAFTPCVLPMVPILSSIIVGEGDGISQRRAFTLSLAYVLGMAVTYAALGTVVGLFGAELNLQAALQSPPVLVFFALVFVVLSLAMFGFYELQLPQSWQNRLNAMGNRQQGGKHASVLVMGSLSSLVVSPCVSAPLAGALIYISTSNDAVLGGTALLALGLGMGVPLLIVGASGGHWLPRAGAWMNSVKAVFGVLLLGVAIWLLERVVAPQVTLALWAALLLGSAVYLGVLDFSPRQGIAQLGKAVGAMSFLWGTLLLIGAASGAEDPLKPLARVAAVSSAGGGANSAQHGELEWLPVKSLADVQARIAASEQPVILDLYADWCISCKTMERNVFPAPDVASKLRQFTLLRADVTDNDETDRALLNHYGLFGPPSLVFFAPDGSEIAEVRIQGEVGREALATHLGSVLGLVDSGNVGQIAANFP